MLAAGKFADKLRENTTVRLIVRELVSGTEVPEEEYAKLPGFTPKVLWFHSRT
jgi:tyrosinase